MWGGSGDYRRPPPNDYPVPPPPPPPITPPPHAGGEAETEKGPGGERREYEPRTPGQGRGGTRRRSSGPSSAPSGFARDGEPRTFERSGARREERPGRVRTEGSNAQFRDVLGRYPSEAG